MKKISNEEVAKQLLDKGFRMADGERYKGVDTKMTCVDRDGYLVHSTLYRIRTGEPFRFGKNNPYTIDNIKHFIKKQESYSESITLISDVFESSDKDLKFECKEHGEFNITWNNFQQGSGCYECGIKRRNFKLTKTHEEFEGEVFDLVGNEYSVLSSYKSARDKVVMKHNKCGNEWDVNPDSFLRGVRCPICMRKLIDLNRRKTHKEFEKEFYKHADGEYELVSEYKTVNDKVNVKHKKCGNIYPVAPCSFIAGRRCPRCTRSKGEIEVLKYLNRRNVKYKKEYKIEECRNQLPLPFDFAIFDNESLIALIEYQGIQHYKPVEFFGGDIGFKYRKKNDGIKKNYCKLNNIPFIEIPYTINDIETYLDEELSKLNKLTQQALIKQ